MLSLHSPELFAEEATTVFPSRQETSSLKGTQQIKCINSVFLRAVQRHDATSLEHQLESVLSYQIHVTGEKREHLVLMSHSASPVGLTISNKKGGEKKKKICLRGFRDTSRDVRCIPVIPLPLELLLSKVRKLLSVISPRKHFAIRLKCVLVSPLTAPINH